MWLFAGILAAGAAAGVCLPWWWKRFAGRDALRRRSINVAAYRGRLLELDADAQAGLLPPDELERTKEETAARLLEDAQAAAAPEAERTTAWLAGGAAAALALFAGTWYGLAGSWRTQELIDLSLTDPEAARAQSVEQMVGRLEARLGEEPDNPEVATWLGRAYRTLGNNYRAAEALARANELTGGRDPDLLVEHGEVLAELQDRSFVGAPAGKFLRALELAPEHPRALWNAGLAALQADDASSALTYWERLARQDLPEDFRSALEHSIAQLRQRGAVAAPEPAVPDALALRIRVGISPELADQAGRGAALFVIAREPSGSRVPLAVRRLEVSAFPVEVRLDDSHSMVPARKLSGADRWRITARISRGGTAEPAPGDLEGEIELSRSDADRPQDLIIERKLP